MRFNKQLTQNIGVGQKEESFIKCLLQNLSKFAQKYVKLQKLLYIFLIYHQIKKHYIFYLDARKSWKWLEVVYWNGSQIRSTSDLTIRIWTVNVLLLDKTRKHIYCFLNRWFCKWLRHNNYRRTIRTWFYRFHSGFSIHLWSNIKSEIARLNM